jgi:hypothetical protein
MKLATFEIRKAIGVLCFLAGAMNLMPTSAYSQTLVDTGDLAQSPAQSRFHLAQYRQCSQEFGPFVTQSTAWQRWRNARSSGISVSRGVVPCYGGGYCFYAYFSC